METASLFRFQPADSIGTRSRHPFFGPLVLSVRNKIYSSGLKTFPCGMLVFISEGISWTIYPVRPNGLPEIAVLELVPYRLN